MDAIVGVWVTSLLGAAAFSTAGYVLGQRGVVVPFLGLGPAPSKDAPSPPPDLHSLPTPVMGIPRNELDLPTPPPAVVKSTPPSLVETPRVPSVALAGDGDEDDGDRPTFIPDKATQMAVVASAAASVPPQMQSIQLELEAAKADLEAALSKADAAMQRARAAEAIKVELERQIDGLRSELKNEVVARASAEAAKQELGDRLANASAETSSLRHKVSLLDKQARQLREALQGRVRALTTSELHRKRDLEETEEMRVKLRDVYEKLERSSLPPSQAHGSQSSQIPTPPRPMLAVKGAPEQRSDEPSALRDEVARLTKENRELRAQALGILHPKQPSGGSTPDVDLESYKQLVTRVKSVPGLRGAVVADEMGAVLIGSGELDEGMAAFGAYIRDASSRTERLLPLEAVEEIDIRDRKGTVLSTRVLTSGAMELSLVLFGGAETSLVAAKKLVGEHLKRGNDWI